MTTTDAYKDKSGTANSALDVVEIVTPSDADDLPFISNGIYVCSEGTVKITTRGGSVLTLPTSPFCPIYWPFYVKKIWATGTTATSIIAGTIA